MKQLIKNLPILGQVALRLQNTLTSQSASFPGSEKYWVQRYDKGKNSGAGSYNNLAKFKAEVLNSFVADNEISSVIEFGCGDGNQLSLANYPSYHGYDISQKALSICKNRFAADPGKSFSLVSDYQGEQAELVISLDVIYHLIEDCIFVEYLNRLFDASQQFVIIYSSNTDSNPDGTASHVRHRQFTRWVAINRPEWKMIQHIPNRYPYSGNNKNSSFADFYIYEKQNS